MMRKSKKTRRATADVLPECLVHKIVSCLSLEEAAQMSVLSKAWLQAYQTHPTVEFGVSRRWWRRGDITVRAVDKIMNRYWDQNIPIHRFVYRRLPYDERLLGKWLYIALQNGLKNLDLRDCDLRRVSLFTSHAANTWNLRTLSLCGVYLDENALQNLLASCPSIVDLIVDHCHELEKIELRNLQKLRSLTVKVYERMPIRIQVPVLEHLHYSGPSMKELRIDNYDNLKSLEISCREKSDSGGFLERLISTSQYLECLVLAFVGFDSDSGAFDLGSCWSHSLRVLKLENCEVTGEIDAPNLVSFVNKGVHIPQLKFAKVSSQLKCLKVILNCRDAMWFFDLRNFMLNLVPLSQVSLVIPFKMTSINWDNLKLCATVTTPTPQVDILDVDIKVDDIKCPEEWPLIVDALLWSCHPKRLNLSSSVQIITCFTRGLMQMKNSGRSSIRGGEPWLSHLKQVKAYMFDLNNQPVEFKGRPQRMYLSNREKVYFLLDWCIDC